MQYWVNVTVFRKPQFENQLSCVLEFQVSFLGKFLLGFDTLA